MPERVPLFGNVSAGVFAGILKAQLEAWAKEQDAVTKPLDEWWNDFVEYCSTEKQSTEDCPPEKSGSYGGTD